MGKHHHLALTVLICIVFLLGVSVNLGWLAREDPPSILSLAKSHCVAPKLRSSRSAAQLMPPTQSASLDGPLGNLTSFSVLVEPLRANEICSQRDIFMVILIDSAPSHFQARAAIRNALGAMQIPRVNIAHVFLLGSFVSPLDNCIVANEMETHGDMLQGDFHDGYLNQSLTDLMGLRWASRRCGHARFIMKTDDDIFTDLFQMVDVLDVLGHPPLFVACATVSPHNKVVRDKKDKCYVSEDEYPNKYYPPYCAGSTFFLNPRTAEVLDRRALSNWAALSMNDAYLTGVLVDMDATIRLMLLDSGFATDQSVWKKWLDSTTELGPSRDIIGQFPRGDVQLARNVALKMRGVATQHRLPAHAWQLVNNSTSWV